MPTPPIEPHATLAPQVPDGLTPQAASLLKYIQAHGSVTQREALLDLSIQSLTKRIHELRRHFVIVSDHRVHKTTQQRYVRYFYKGPKPQNQVKQALAAGMPSQESAYSS